MFACPFQVDEYKSAAERGEREVTSLGAELAALKVSDMVFFMHTTLHLHMGTWELPGVRGVFTSSVCELQVSVSTHGH